MKSNLRLKIVILAFSAASLFSGCVMVDRDFRLTRNEIFSSFSDMDLNTEVQFQIGAELITLGRIAIAFTDIEPDVREMLQEIHSLQVGVYQIENSKTNLPRIPTNIEQRLKQRGYSAIVKVKDRDENVWIFTRIHRHRLRAMYVISLDREELVLIEMEGRLGKLIEKAVRDRGFKQGRKQLIASNLKN
ncbi:MAG: DUF4252 domain-containing protein [Calditrichaeota bacterium]|nr:DUF4252 domain-containing protein [Calditrichota bacterium]